MARFKATMFFEQGATGWSESFYKDASSEVAIHADARDLASIRMGCGNAILFCTFIRVEDIAAPGTASLKEVNLRPKNLFPADTPWQSLLIRILATDGSRRMFLMRGMPDIMIFNGEFAPTAEYTAKLNLFLNALAVLSWRLKVVKKSNLLLNVASVSTAGLMETVTPHSLTINSVVRFHRTYDTDGHLVSGDYRVSAVPTTTTANLVNWSNVRSVTTGKVRKFEEDYPAISGAEIRRAAKRNTGRPFGLPLGRRRRSA